MKKATALLVTSACALTISSNSLAMLTKVSSIKQIKKIRSLHTSTPTYGIGQVLYTANRVDEVLDKANANNDLLHKIIQQNEDNNKLLKENNLLLRTIAKQNFVYNPQRAFPNQQVFHDNLRHLRSNYSDIDIKRNEDLLEHYHILKKQYDIDITYLLE